MDDNVKMAQDVAGRLGAFTEVPYDGPNVSETQHDLAMDVAEAISEMLDARELDILIWALNQKR